MEACSHPCYHRCNSYVKCSHARPASQSTELRRFLVHSGLSTFTTFLLITTRSSALIPWTTLLGLSSAACSAMQYIPQLKRTWSLRLVGSLSIITMCIQSPGAALMCLSIGIRSVTSFVLNANTTNHLHLRRPGTNWTSKSSSNSNCWVSLT
jgi:hypothetical protein